MFYMLKWAMQKDVDIDSFVFASESCLPIVPLEQCFSSDSYMKYSNGPTNGYSQQMQFDVLRNALRSGDAVFKADQWVLLSRPHALHLIGFMDAIDRSFHTHTLNNAHSNAQNNTYKTADGSAVNNANINAVSNAYTHPTRVLHNPHPSSSSSRSSDHRFFELFQGVHASDEMFFPTGLAILGHLPSADVTPDPPTSQKGKGHQWRVIQRRVTYCDWSESPKNPKQFDDWRQAVECSHVARALTEGCWVLRKIKMASRGPTRLMEWTKVVYSNEEVLAMTENELQDLLLSPLGGGGEGEEGREKDRKRRRGH
mmetsp:Transcript_33306/g.48225  ORF Transcript_33306/g.48225 Transcript_33306/m.48225 type:complete len:312 (+) Transcript_33306:457-1392(+)